MRFCIRNCGPPQHVVFFSCRVFHAVADVLRRGMFRFDFRARSEFHHWFGRLIAFLVMLLMHPRCASRGSMCLPFSFVVPIAFSFDAPPLDAPGSSCERVRRVAWSSGTFLGRTEISFFVGREVGPTHQDTKHMRLQWSFRL